MKNALNSLIQSLVKMVFVIIGCFPKNKLIYFESFHGKQCSDNPKAIYDYFIKHHPDYQLVWGASKGAEGVFSKQAVPYVTRFSWRWFWLMPRAQVWVINTRTPLYLVKSRHTRYIQTWHGTPLKKIGLDIPVVQIAGYNTQSYQRAFLAETARWDYLLSPNHYCSQIFPEAFGYRGQLVESGYPRNDALVNYKDNRDYVDELKVKLSIPKNKKVILYAPTWRENQKFTHGTYEFEKALDFQKIADTFGSELVLLVRLHYLVSATLDFSSYSEVIQDVSDYPEMTDLLLVSDVLMTDYSSCFVDFMITKRPIVFYLYDKRHYEEQLRGLYVVPEDDFPGAVVTTEDMLFDWLKKYLITEGQELPSEYQATYRAFNELEIGKASENVVKLIIESTGIKR